jgi:dihydrolipoamide dehydrogenase
VRVGCIPSKALIELAHVRSAVAHWAGAGLATTGTSVDLAAFQTWKTTVVDGLNRGLRDLFRARGIEVVRGAARFNRPDQVAVECDDSVRFLQFRDAVIATGSRSVDLPALPRDGGRVLDSTDALGLTSVPGELVVVGGGYIGVELGTAFAKLGAKVMIVEAEDRILPAYDIELTRPVARRLKALGVEVLTGAKASGLSDGGKALRVSQQGGQSRDIPADKILVATGRRARIAGLGLDRLDLTMNGPFVRIDERCATSMYNVWAVGDLTGEPMLAHRAMAQGVIVAEIIAGHRRVFDPVAIPAVCFTDPEIVTVGLTPDAARGAAHDVLVSTFPLAANGRALTLGAEDGFVRVTARADNHLVLGIAAVGAGVSELSSAFGLALEMGARLEDIGGTIHAHPTLGEAFHEASLRALGEALHI